MNFTSFNWTSKRVFVVTLLSFFIFAQVTHAATGVKFDSGSKSLAKTWQDVKGMLPHEPIPDNYEELKDFGDWGMDYAIGIAKIVGPGFAIAILSLLAGIIYGLFKLLRMCCGFCCKKKKSDDDDDEDEDEDEDNKPKDKYTWGQKWVPTIFYFVFFVFLLTGMAFGLLNNPRFSKGINDMGDSVVNVGAQAVDLGRGLSSNVTYIAELVPLTIDGLEEQFSGVGPLADQVVVLSNDINATSASVDSITKKIGEIDAGNVSAVTALYQELDDSATIIGQMSDLTYQIAEKLRETYDETIGTLDEKVGDIQDTVDELKQTADDIIQQADDLVSDVTGYVDDGKSYDKTRATVLMALFIVVIVVTFLIVLGFVFRIKAIFNTVAAFSFVFLFLLWLSGSIHFLLGMALYDACPVVDVVVRGMLPDDSSAADVLEGCLYEDRSVLDSLNITAYNLSSVFDYRSQFKDVADFSADYNFSAVDNYFIRIQNLYTYNLSAIADNITVASFNWTDQYVYDALDAMNEATDPYYYDLSNYTKADPDDFGPRNETVAMAQEAVTLALEANVTAYNKTETARTKLYEAQIDIDNLMANMTIFQARFNETQKVIRVLETQNITNSIAILDYLQGNITAFFDLGNCSFLGVAYVDIRTSLCQTMQPSIDLLTVGQFLAGLALIPLVILAEVLSFRIPKCKNLNPLDYYDDEDDDYDEEKAYKKSAVDMDVKYGDKRNPALSATISASVDAPTTNSASSSPDFGATRKNQVHPVSDTPLLHQQQNYVLPPLVKKGGPPPVS